MPFDDSTTLFRLPKEPIDRVLAPLVRFMHVQAAGGLVLLVATLTAVAVANSPWGPAYLEFWEIPVGLSIGTIEFKLSLVHWINDALMAVFFFVTGLEVKREIVHGELHELRRAMLPLVAALGGMLAPAGVYLVFQAHRPGQSGWGIPMATDIAFVVGCMMLLGRRVPFGLRIMLLTLAIADDIGAILVIALGYSSHFDASWLFIGLVLVGLLVLAARLGVRSMPAYIVLGALIWMACHRSGIHATIAGVVLGLLTPARPYLGAEFLHRLVDRVRDYAEGDWNQVEQRAQKVRLMRKATREVVSPVEFLETTLHSWVSFIVMPLFALANAGVVVRAADMVSPVALAVMAGLVVGKPLGVFVASYLAVKAGLARLPTGVTWRTLFAGGCLCGIGFTMALFIATLALDEKLLDEAKIGILCGSVVSAVLGIVLLLWTDPASDLAGKQMPAAD